MKLWWSARNCANSCSTNCVSVLSRSVPLTIYSYCHNSLLMLISILFLVYLARMSWRFDSGRYCCRKWWLQIITSMNLHYSLNLFSLLVGSFPKKNARLNICKCETADQLIRDSWKHRCTTNMLPPSWKRVPFKPIKYLFFVVALLDTRDPINKWCCFQGSRLIWLYSTLRPKASWPRDYGLYSCCNQRRKRLDARMMHLIILLELVIQRTLIFGAVPHWLHSIVGACELWLLC